MSDVSFNSFNLLHGIGQYHKHKEARYCADHDQHFYSTLNIRAGSLTGCG